MGDGNSRELNLSKYKVLSICMEVKDLNKTIEYYSSNFGIGPFVVQERSNDCILHGREAHYTARWAIAPLGEGQVILEFSEIIEGESIHTEFLEKNGEGVSYICLGVPDVDAKIAKFKEKGIEVLQYCRRKDGGVFAYMDTGKVGGLVIELLEGGLTGVEKFTK